MNLKKAGCIMFLLLAFVRMGQAQENNLKFFLVERLDGKPLGKIRNMTQDAFLSQNNGLDWPPCK